MNLSKDKPSTKGTLSTNQNNTNDNSITKSNQNTNDDYKSYQQYSQKYSSRKQNKRKRKIVKRSYGIACCRYVNNEMQILLVKKRYTYAFCDFLHGSYKRKNIPKNKMHEYFVNEFSKMTVDEKLDILSLDYERMWYRVWLNEPKDSGFYTAKSRFQNTFLIDGGPELLKRLVNNSTHSNLIWEIPKGRKSNKDEPDINCAVREFHEETTVEKSTYKIITNKKYTYSFTDENITYVVTYYPAVSYCGSNVKIKLSGYDQIAEIADIKWMNINDVKYHDSYNRLEKVTKGIFKQVRSAYK